METRLKKLKELERLYKKLSTKELNKSSWQSRVKNDSYWIRIWEEHGPDKIEHIKEHQMDLEFAKNKLEEFECQCDDCMKEIEKIKKELFKKNESTRKN